MTHLTTEAPERLHLLSLLVRARLEEALATADGQARAAKVKAGTVGIVAGGVSTRLSFQQGGIHLDQGDPKGADARAVGTLAAVVALCSGKIRVTDVLRGHLRVSGKVGLLRHALPLLQSGPDDER